MADTAEDIVRPAWVPANAVWVNGLWHVNGVKIYEGTRPQMTDRERGEAQKALHAAEYEKQQVQLREGLSAGQYRHGGLIYGRDAKSIGPDDQSWRPGHAERREERIAGIKEASEAQQEAITALERATQRKLEADARFAKSYETKEA